MRVIVLFVACAVLGALGLYCLFFVPAAPLTVVAPAIAFAAVVGAMSVMRQLLPFAFLAALRIASFVFGIAIVALAAMALGETGTLWMVWGIALAALVAAVLALVQRPPAPAVSH